MKLGCLRGFQKGRLWWNKFKWVRYYQVFRMFSLVIFSTSQTMQLMLYIIAALVIYLLTWSPFSSAGPVSFFLIAVSWYTPSSASYSRLLNLQTMHNAHFNLEGKINAQ
jgi:hypothetical protein